MRPTRLRSRHDVIVALTMACCAAVQMQGKAGYAPTAEQRSELLALIDANPRFGAVGTSRIPRNRLSRCTRHPRHSSATMRRAPISARPV